MEEDLGKSLENALTAAIERSPFVPGVLINNMAMHEMYIKARLENKHKWKQESLEADAVALWHIIINRVMAFDERWTVLRKYYVNLEANRASSDIVAAYTGDWGTSQHQMRVQLIVEVKRTSSTPYDCLDALDAEAQVYQSCQLLHRNPTEMKINLKARPVFAATVVGAGIKFWECTPDAGFSYKNPFPQAAVDPNHWKPYNGGTNTEGLTELGGYLDAGRDGAKILALLKGLMGDKQLRYPIINVHDFYQGERT